MRACEAQTSSTDRMPACSDPRPGSHRSRATRTAGLCAQVDTHDLHPYHAASAPTQNQLRQSPLHIRSNPLAMGAVNQVGSTAGLPCSQLAKPLACHHRLAWLAPLSLIIPPCCSQTVAGSCDPQQEVAYNQGKWVPFETDRVEGRIFIAIKGCPGSNQEVFLGKKRFTHVVVQVSAWHCWLPCCQ